MTPPEKPRWAPYGPDRPLRATEYGSRIGLLVLELAAIHGGFSRESWPATLLECRRKAREAGRKIPDAVAQYLAGVWSRAALDLAWRDFKGRAQA